MICIVEGCLIDTDKLNTIIDVNNAAFYLRVYQAPKSGWFYIDTAEFSLKRTTGAGIVSYLERLSSRNGLYEWVKALREAGVEIPDVN